jgi:hypothetical protein
MNKTQNVGRATEGVRPYSLSSVDAEREGPNSLRSRSANCPGLLMVGAFFPPWASTNKSLAQIDKSPDVGKATNARAIVPDEKENAGMIKYVLAMAILAGIAALPSIANAECGTRGGPGLRGRDGKCQPWDRVQSVCGADGSRCQRERVSPLLPKIDTVPAHKLMECAHGMRNDC